jgi:hypothetical protein
MWAVRPRKEFLNLRINMSKFIKFLFLSFLLSLWLATPHFAQTNNCYNLAENSREPYPEQIKEKLIELCIERAKKDFQEMLEESEEVAKLTEELENSYTANNKFNKKDSKKLKRVEKLLNKIRKDLKADDDDEIIDEKPKSIPDALKSLKDKSFYFVKELKKTSRYSISALAIQSSNKVLKLVKFLRFNLN